MKVRFVVVFEYYITRAFEREVGVRRTGRPGFSYVARTLTDHCCYFMVFGQLLILLFDTVKGNIFKTFLKKSLRVEFAYV